VSTSARPIALVDDQRQALILPRGRFIDAERIVQKHFLDDKDLPIVTPRWVRDNMPYKIQLSHSRVAWYDGDVLRILAEASRLGIPLKEVKLADLEGAA
jgi:hypothetical protein